MKKLILIYSLLVLTGSIPAKANKPADSTEIRNNKKGWNFGLVPAVSYDTDLGYQYGAAVNFYDYGDGSKFPTYRHSIYFEISRYTQGSGVYRLFYDSKYLVPKIQVTADLSYLPELAYSFYGFNGYESVYQNEWEDKNSPLYRTRMFYRNQENLLRFKVDLQGQLGDSPFRWIAGFNLLSFDIASVDIDRLNKGKKEADKLPSLEEQPGLFEKYKQWGLINKEEGNGGFIPELKGGFVYDTRDNQPNPYKGIWSEAVVAFVPEFLGAETGFSKISLTHRQYFPLLKDLSLAFRLGWQQTLAEHVPFYYQPQIITSFLAGSSSTGLGGAKNIRGILRNRIVGDGFAYSNLELRWKFARMNLFRQNFYWGLNFFTDAGMVTKKIDIKNKLNLIQEPLTDYFNEGKEKLHQSIGAGLRLVMNYNFIIAADYGVALNNQDGDSGIYIGMNYLF
jgi:outer membrane protein assembly factor BamA